MNVDYDAARLERLLEKVEAMADMVERHDKLLFGQNGELGIAHQLKLMWRLHIWILCSLSALGGAIITAATIYFMKIGP